MVTAGIDENLIALMGKGDKEAFSELYQKTSDAVYGLSLSILKRKEDAEDVMHDAYLRIYREAPKYRKEGKPLAWIFRIVRNMCLNRIRDARDASGEVPDAADPADEIERSTDRMVLAAAMSVLAEDEREIVVLHALTGLKQKEIADALGMPQGTVLSKYNRALRKMRIEIEGKTEGKEEAR